jgi:hypothetical protein
LEQGEIGPAPLRSRRRDDGRGEAVRSVVSGLRTGSRVLDGLAAFSLMACCGSPALTTNRSKHSAA